MTPTWNDLDDRRSRWVNIFARLKPGVTMEQAGAGMQVLFKQVLEHDIKDTPTPPNGFRTRFLAKPLVLMPGQKGDRHPRAVLRPR